MTAQTEIPSRSILLVEDSARIRNLLAGILGGQGWSVREAQSAEAALAAIPGLRHTIDLLITDLALPGISGLELAGRLRQLYPAMKVLCVSGHALPNVPLDGIHFIEKPFRPETFLNKAKELLGFS